MKTTGGPGQVPNCMICQEPERARLIEADWVGGMTAAGIATRMTAAGWPIVGGTVLNHLKKHVKDAATRSNVPAGLGRRDAAVFIRDRILDEVERREQAFRMAVEDGMPDDVIDTLRPDILDKDLQPALNTAIKAEAVVAKREDSQSKRKIDLFKLMLGDAGGLAPKGLIGDGLTIEGEFEEVLNDDAEA